jgi:hypothetical protein
MSTGRVVMGMIRLMNSEGQAMRDVQRLRKVQRRSSKQHLMVDGGNWPTTNSELVASYLKSFSRFVKSIDFNKLQ